MCDEMGESNALLKDSLFIIPYYDLVLHRTARSKILDVSLSSVIILIEMLHFTLQCSNFCTLLFSD